MLGALKKKIAYVFKRRMVPNGRFMPGLELRKTLVSTICPSSSMNYPLRDKIARDMWQMWVEANRPHLDGRNCPREFYFMAEIGMKCVCKELDNMILDIVKQRLENLYENQD